ncbi:molybdenum cofactor guanylyltransferase [Cellulosimicrobium arenosum]|uniref:NTP transferase domain-containing protein n=1 Tax=Cellulosimicrobium arenosum TaxID=2708133 RepID=A0A927G870_9MICO|nr:NTP transferase domain-containing protein [Cellulosimicrobium arenosum]MBD8078706.1 NTP transferase domain-containing protein [Cellulosimicrobium arenosum]
MTADPDPPDAAADVAFDAVVLAGGRASRLGTPKPGLVVAGRPLLDHALAATSGARARVVVGPDDLADPERYALTREDPPFGGPVAGIAAGLAALPATPDDGPAPWVLVLACDVPQAATMVPLLLAALASPDGDGPGVDGSGADAGADPVDAVRAVRGGRDQWLVGLYRRSALDAAVERLRADGGVDGAPAHRLLCGLVARTVEDDEGLTADVDTWQDAHEHDRRPR